MQSKFEKLKEYLNGLNGQGILLAFSGGIDSALLLYLCKDLDILAVTFKSVFQTKEEIDSARDFCKKHGVEHKISEFFPLEDSILQNNPKDRCYRCKKLIFTGLKNVANGRVIIDGTNFDDLNGYRPGLRALEECGVISPFVKFEITKSEIRAFAKDLGIEIYNKPSSPCLATRFPYGTKLTKENLALVEAGEKILKGFGFENCRLRLHGNLARIEVLPEQFEKLLSLRRELVGKLKTGGVKYVTIDIEGLRSGSMDI